MRDLPVQVLARSIQLEAQSAYQCFDPFFHRPLSWISGSAGAGVVEPVRPLLRSCLLEGFRGYETATHSFAVAHSTMHAHLIILVAGGRRPGYSPARIRCTTGSNCSRHKLGFIPVDFPNRHVTSEAVHRYAHRAESGHTRDSRPGTGRRFEPYPRHQMRTDLSAACYTNFRSRPLPSISRMPSRRLALQHSTHGSFGPSALSCRDLTSEDPQFLMVASMQAALVADAKLDRRPHTTGPRPVGGMQSAIGMV